MRIVKETEQIRKGGLSPLIEKCQFRLLQNLNYIRSDYLMGWQGLGRPVGYERAMAHAMLKLDILLGRNNHKIRKYLSKKREYLADIKKEHERYNNAVTSFRFYEYIRTEPNYYFMSIKDCVTVTHIIILSKFYIDARLGNIIESKVLPVNHSYYSKRHINQKIREHINEAKWLDIESWASGVIDSSAYKSILQYCKLKYNTEIGLSVKP